MLILGPLLPLTSVPFFALLIAAAGRVAGWMRASTAERWLDGGAVTLFLGVGLRMLTRAPR